MPILFLTVLVDLIGFGIVIPILPFLAPTLGAGSFDIAMVIAIYSLAGGLAGPFWGRLSDRLGRKPVLLICLAGAAASHLMLAFTGTLAMLLVNRALAGLMAGNFGVAAAMVADLSTAQNRAKSMGLIGAAFGLGMVAGPFLGGVLSGDGNFRLAALAACGLSTAALIGGALLLKESLPAAQRGAIRAQHVATPAGSVLAMLRSTGNTLLAGQFFLSSVCHTASSYLFPLWVAHFLGWGPREVGMVFGAQGLCMAALQGGLIGRLVRALGELRLLLLGTALMSLAFLIGGAAVGAVTIILAFFAVNTGGAMTTPVLNALVANRTPVHLRGRMLGTTSSSGAFGRVAGPLVAGALLSIFGFDAAWYGGTVFALLMVAYAATRLRLEGSGATLPAADPAADQTRV